MRELSEPERGSSDTTAIPRPAAATDWRHVGRIELHQPDGQARDFDGRVKAPAGMTVRGGHEKFVPDQFVKGPCPRPASG